MQFHFPDFCLCVEIKAARHCSINSVCAAGVLPVGEVSDIFSF